MSLVVKELRDVEAWDILETIDEVPADLDEFYGRMMQQVLQMKRGNSSLGYCRNVLSTVVTVYQPLRLDELATLSGLPDKISSKENFVTDIVAMCGSFLTIQDKVVYLIHQSAKDFLLKRFRSFSLDEIHQVHYSIFFRSLDALMHTLRKDIYLLRHPGFPIDQVKPPEPDHLAAVRYSCLYWPDHLCDSHVSQSASDGLQDGGPVERFLRKGFLYWLEALVLLRSVPQGLTAMAKLEGLVQVSGEYTVIA